MAFAFLLIATLAIALQPPLSSQSNWPVARIQQAQAAIKGIANSATPATTTSKITSVSNGGTLAGNTVNVQAGLDINNQGGAILGLGAGSAVRLNAGRDITLQTTTVGTSNFLLRR